jgi:transposase
MAKVNAIHTLHAQGWSQRKIAEQLGINRETVARQLAAERPKPAKAPTGSDDSKPAKAPTGSEGSRSGCAAHAEAILAMLQQGLSARRIHQDLMAESGFAGSYWSVRRFVQGLTESQPLPFRRIEQPPGEEAQVDFGTGAPLLLPNGRCKRTHVFRIVLSHSRKAYSEAVERQTTENFIRALENAFQHFGGVPRTLVIDNLRAAVQQADWFDPELNPKIEEFSRHYGTVVLPTRPYTPRHKGKVEKGIDYVQSNALKGRRFESLRAQNEHLLEWERTIADTRIHGTTRQQVLKVFQEIEQETLQALPLERFPFFHEGTRRVHRDAHVEVDKAYYSVPPEYVSREVWVRWDSRLVRVFNRRMEQIALHAKQEPGRFSTQQGHLSDKKISSVEKGAAWLLSKIQQIGPHSAEWGTQVIEHRGIQGVRVLQGLLSLARQHSGSEIERACEVAAGYGAYRLKHVRRLIERRAGKQQRFEFLEQHPVIRDVAEYGALVRSALQGEASPPQAQE